LIKIQTEIAMTMDVIREKRGFICDMEGAIYHGNRLLASWASGITIFFNSPVF